jgi:SAM-dependent methyltransferase
VTRAVAARAALLGALLGLVGLGSATLVLAAGPRLLWSIVALAATALVALAVGTWAGAPAAEGPEPPFRGRWLTVGLSVAVAGSAATVLGLNRVVASTTPGRIAELLLVVALPCYAVGMALPVVLAWGERREEEVEAAGQGWGPLGALALGSFGGLAVGVVLGGVLLSRFSAGPVLLVASFAPLLSLAVGEPEPPAQEETVFETASPFGEIRVTEVVYPGERQPERRLYVNGEEESGELVRSGAPTLAYVAAAERWLAEASPPGAAYAFLGGGAYTLPRRIAERDPRARVEVVELDPEVTRVAYRVFGLRPEHGIRTVHGDARAWLAAREPESVDRLYVDVYGGAEALPYALVTREAFAEMSRVLRPGGVAALNVIGCLHGPEALRLWSIVRTFTDVFPGVALYSHLGTDFAERQNFLLAGSADAEARFPARAGLFEPVPREAWTGPAGTTVFRDLFASRAPRENPPPPRAEAAREPRGEASARPT